MLKVERRRHRIIGVVKSPPVVVNSLKPHCAPTLSICPFLHWYRFDRSIGEPDIGQIWLVEFHTQYQMITDRRFPAYRTHYCSCHRHNSKANRFKYAAKQAVHLITPATSLGGHQFGERVIDAECQSLIELHIEIFVWDSLKVTTLQTQERRKIWPRDAGKSDPAKICSTIHEHQPAAFLV